MLRPEKQILFENQLNSKTETTKKSIIMFSKILFVCAVIAAANAGYAPAARYGSQNAGYAAQYQPRATLTVGSNYGGYGGYGNGYGAGYGAGQGAGSLAGLGNLAALAASPSAAIDSEVLNLAARALALPSAGAPLATSINVPFFSQTSYTSPSVAAVNSIPQGATGSSAAAAASNVEKNIAKNYQGSSYGAAPAYGSAY